MKNFTLYFSLVAFLIIGANAFSQNADLKKARVEEIKKWYTEATSFGSKNCKTKTLIKYESFDDNSEKNPFDQKATTCKPNNTYEIVTADLNGYEWNSKTNIYKKEGKIFFIFIEGASEGFSYEKRIYFDKNEIVILQLEREIEGGYELKDTPNKEAKLSSDHLSVKDVIGEDLIEINKIQSEGK